MEIAIIFKFCFFSHRLYPVYVVHNTLFPSSNYQMCLILNLTQKEKKMIPQEMSAYRLRKQIPQEML